ncbi:hypothetical protein J3459_006682 [Metarhizium acridum]|nr:hypothetical protein J3459_006682 [Metarhizium acridum]
MVRVTTEAGDPDCPDAPSSLSDGNEMQESDLMFKLGLVEDCQTEPDYDNQAEILSSELDGENTTPEMQQIEPGHATTPIDPIPRSTVDTGFEMDEDDYEALRLSLGIPKQSEGFLNPRKTPTAIPSPATPGTQIARESQIADRHLASPIQLHSRRRLLTSRSTSPSEARNVSDRFPRRPRKPAYQLLEQEAASILGDWNPRKNKLTSDMNDVSHDEKKPQLASKASSNPQQKRTRSGIQSTLSTANWTVAPKDRLEVVLRPKRRTWLAAYKDVDGMSKSAAEQPRRAGHHGTGRRSVLSSTRTQATSQVEKKKNAVISKNTSSGRPKNAKRRVIGGRVGVIGARRSQRTNAGNLDSAKNTTTSGGVEPTRKGVVEPGSRRGRSSGLPKRRGRPPTRARMSNRRK